MNCDVEETLLRAMITGHNISSGEIAQGLRHRDLTTICGRSPLRARKMIELFEAGPPRGAQPQCGSRSRLNLRRRNPAPKEKTPGAGKNKNEKTSFPSISPKKTQRP